MCMEKAAKSCLSGRKGGFEVMTQDGELDGPYSKISLATDSLC